MNINIKDWCAEELWMSLDLHDGVRQTILWQIGKVGCSFTLTFYAENTTWKVKKTANPVLILIKN